MLTLMSVSNPGVALGWAFLIGLASCQPNLTGESRPPLAPIAKGSVESKPASAPEAAASGFDRIPRLDFNRLAVEHNLPFFWRMDTNSDGTLQPNELVLTWSHAAHRRAEFVDNRARFTKAFSGLYEQMTKPEQSSALSPTEFKRRATVRLELAQGRSLSGRMRNASVSGALIECSHDARPTPS